MIRNSLPAGLRAWLDAMHANVDALEAQQRHGRDAADQWGGAHTRIDETAAERDARWAAWRAESEGRVL